MPHNFPLRNGGRANTPNTLILISQKAAARSMYRARRNTKIKTPNANSNNCPLGTPLLKMLLAKLILLLLHALVLLLEALDALLEVALELLDGSVLLLDGGGDGIGALGLPLGEESFLLVVAQVEVGEAARGAERLSGKGLEGVEVAATLVGLAFGVAGEVLDGGVTLDAELAAEVFVDSAVHVADENRLGISKLVTELVPSRFHRLAVASPDQQRRASECKVSEMPNKTRTSFNGANEERIIVSIYIKNETHQGAWNLMKAPLPAVISS